MTDIEIIKKIEKILKEPLLPLEPGDIEGSHRVGAEFSCYNAGFGVC
jgi:hypothetical protein